LERSRCVCGSARRAGVDRAGFRTHAVSGEPLALLRRIAPYLPAGLRLPHISDDPAETARAPVGGSLIGDEVLTLVGLTALMADYKPKAAKPAAKVAHRMAPHPPSAEMRSSDGTSVRSASVCCAQ
jgi:hypothetical protein